MAKRYATTYSNGHFVQTSNPHEANQWFVYDDAQAFHLSGKVVSWSDFRAAVEAAMEAKLEKKMQAHKKIYYREGVSKFSPLVSKWIRK